MLRCFRHVESFGELGKFDSCSNNFKDRRLYPAVSVTVHLRYVHGISLLRIRIGLPIFPPLFLLTLDDDLSTKCSERRSDGLFLFQSRKSTGLFLMHQLQTTSHSVQTFLSEILLAYWPGFYLVGCLVSVVSIGSNTSRERERFVFRQLDPGKGIRRSPLSEDNMSLRLRGGSTYAY